MTMAPSPAMEWIDSHCHFDSFVEEGTERAVLDRAVAAGLTLVVAIGGSPAANERTRSLAQTYPGLVVGTVGYDRDLANDAPSLASLAAQARLDGVVAIGETGLDYHYEPETAAAQKNLFQAQLELAAEARRPVVVHTRDADDDTVDLLRAYTRIWTGEADRPGVIHCFTGDYPFARRLLDLGFFISFSGILTFRNADQLRDAARRIPLDRILIETDAPYLAPVPFRGKPNEPAWVRQVAETLATVQGVALQTVSRKTTDNARYLFGVHKETCYE